MKKLLLFTSILFVSYQSYCQEEILFKSQYKPDMVYTQSVVSTSKGEIKYTGPETLLKKIEEKNIENPISTFKKTFIKSKNTTGKLNQNSFPLSIEFIGGTDGIIPDKTFVFGKVTLGETPILDSISSPKMEAEARASFLKTMKSMISQIALPEKKVKIGESFSREMPIKLPIGKYIFDLKNTVVYTLKKIENKKAFFDITQTYSFESTMNGLDMNANGSGSGQIIYDIENTFYLSYELKSTINMELQSNEVSFKGTTESTFTQETTITQEP
jgi:hypothetical protein